MRNLARVNKKWMYCKRMAKFTFAFWLIETIIYQFIDGWHWKATSQGEIICDGITQVSLWISLILFIMVIGDVIDYILDEESRFPFI